MHFQPQEWRFIAFFFFLFLILTFSSIVAPSLTPTWYSIDGTVAIFCLIAIAFTFIPEGNPVSNKLMTAVTQFYSYGSMDNIFTKTTPSNINKLRIVIFIALIISAAFIIPQILFTLLDLSIVLPTTLSIIGVGAALSSIFLVAFIQPVIEEVFRAGILDKTIAGWSMTYLGTGIIIMLTGALLMFFLYFAAFYIGLVILLIGIIWTVVTRNQPIRWNTQPTLLNRQFGIFAAALILSGLHVYSYQSLPNFQSAFVGLLVLFIIMSEVNFIMNSMMPSIVMHSTYNAFAFGGTNYVYVIYGFMISALLIFTLYMIYPSRFARR